MMRSDRVDESRRHWTFHQADFWPSTDWFPAAIGHQERPVVSIDTLCSGSSVAPAIMISRSRFRPGVGVVLAIVSSTFSTSALAARGDEDSLIRQVVESRRKQNDAEALELFR